MIIRSILIILLFVSFFGLSQDKEVEKKKNYSEFFDYLIDDVFLSVGINRGGIFWSNFYPEMRDDNGFNIGIESYTPIMDKSFFNFGLLYVQNRFGHVPSLVTEDEKIVFRNHSIQAPLYASFELPTMREYDFRFNLGIHLKYRLLTTQERPYPEVVTENGYYHDGGEFFYPESNRLKRFDGGMFFGLSWERSNFFFRLRSASGVNNLYSSEQGMLHAFYIDAGYFLFRAIRNKN